MAHSFHGGYDEQFLNFNSNPSVFPHDPPNKMLYTPSFKVRNRSRLEVEEYCKEKCINLEGDSIPYPIQNFTDYEMPIYISNGIQKLGFSEPTPIQAQGWPIALGGTDLVGIAQTGSGKTLAFVLPAIVHIKNQKKLSGGEGPIALVLAPTHELALQILKMAKEFTEDSNILPVCVYGGTPKEKQIAKLMKSPQLLIATPGRLIDFLKSGKTNMGRCSYLVLDEADRLLDMGFEPQLRAIIGQIRPDRQTLMFSATWPKAVQNLASSFMSGYIKINIGSMELSANHNICQIVEICREKKKWQKIMNIIEEVITTDIKTKILIFGRTKSRVNQLARGLKNAGYKCLAIHSDKNQNARGSALKKFSSGDCPILISTDCAGRGLDMDNIKLVINYDYPKCSEDYIHRIGRTARWGKSGTSYTLITHDDAMMAKDLINVLKEAKQEVPYQLYSLVNFSTSKKSIPQTNVTPKKREITWWNPGCEEAQRRLKKAKKRYATARNVQTQTRKNEIHNETMKIYKEAKRKHI